MPFHFQASQERLTDFFDHLSNSAILRAFGISIEIERVFDQDISYKLSTSDYYGISNVYHLAYDNGELTLTREHNNDYLLNQIKESIKLFAHAKFGVDNITGDLP